MTRVLILLAFMVLGFSCAGSNKQVQRIDVNSVTDLSGRWNDTDSRLVAEEMINDCLGRPWLESFLNQKGTRPVVTIGRIRNMTADHLDTETFSKDFERELLNSGRVRFIATKLEREDVRDERMDQSEFSRNFLTEESLKKLRNEIGANYILLGSVKSITDQVEGSQVVYYQTDLELIDVESVEKVWIGTHKIKKSINQKSSKW